MEHLIVDRSHLVRADPNTVRVVESRGGFVVGDMIAKGWVGYLRGWKLEEQELEGEKWRHQKYAVEAARSVPGGRGILKIPTGGGKTRIARGIAEACGGLWVYVVYGRDLVEQAKKTLAGSAIVCGWGAFERVEEADGVIIDECHGLGALGRWRTALRVRSPRWIGLSATPLDRGEGNERVIDILGGIIYEISVEELTARGVLSKVKTRS
ncbi:MAG: hypothetical protein D6812_11875 [Deltaproteobacteria bacterium]|nr:MAG: hypothetical protein D6812_11875 [Deltaproteobacteria bacterium]